MTKMFSIEAKSLVFQAKAFVCFILWCGLLKEFLCVKKVYVWEYPFEGPYMEVYAIYHVLCHFILCVRMTHLLFPVQWWYQMICPLSYLARPGGVSERFGSLQVHMRHINWVYYWLLVAYWLKHWTTVQGSSPTSSRDFISLLGALSPTSNIE